MNHPVITAELAALHQRELLGNADRRIPLRLRRRRRFPLRRRGQ